MRELEVTEVITEPGAGTAESPVWDRRQRRLLWVDIPRGQLWSWTPGRGATLLHRCDVALSAVCLRSNGGLVLTPGCRVEVWRDLDRTPDITIGIDEDATHNRMNDAACDAEGRLWVGSMSLERTRGTANLYKVERTSTGLAAERVLSGVTVSNGIDWSLDSRLMYYADSPTEKVDVFDFDPSSGTISNRKVFARETQGRPDGLTVDAEGYIWVALFSGWAVHRYSPHGDLDMVLRLPTSLVTSVAFGGDDLEDLFITTGAGRLSESERAAQPLAGAIFRCRPGPRGRPPFEFRG